MTAPTDGTPQTQNRRPWHDRWLLDAIRERSAQPLPVGPANTAWEALEAAGVPTEQIRQVVCAISGSPRADLTGVGPDLAELLPETLAMRFDVVPVRFDGRFLEVATSNPLANNYERDLAFASGRLIHVAVASPDEIRQARARIYRHAVTVLPTSRLTWATSQTPNTPASAPTRGVAVDTLERIIVDAIDQRASDIHFEPQDGELFVRFRVDGVLHDVLRIPPDVTPLLLSRLKVAAGLDIANRLRPQDGRAATLIDGRQVDLRISTLPLGERIEKAVVRILDANSTALSFDHLGFSEAERDTLGRILASHEGMVLVTGPTGSGKTTTLYTALQYMLSRETNIVTVEDPIEYRLDGINQVQVNEKAGLTFASALRSILRQDPDVVLVGEVRDAETATIAIRASMTGHMVLSTLHTNDASSAIGRLADIGVDMSALAGALKAVIAQRLVRRLCTQCCIPATVEEMPKELHWVLEGRDLSGLRAPVGCPACRGTGYRGRMAIAEMLVIDDETQHLMARSSQRLEILQLARKNGMNTLWEAGFDRVLRGLTSLRELLANVNPPIPDSNLRQEDVDRLLLDMLGGGVPTREEPVVPPLMAPREESPPAPAVRPTLRPLESVSVPGTARLVVAARAPSDGRPRVLVVHEERARRRDVREALERVGCVVLEAADGDAALTYASRLRPDAVITDAVLPRLDGLGLLQMLRSSGAADRVFLYTDQRDPQLLEWALELGATDALTTEDDASVLATRVMAELPIQPVALVR